MPIRRGFTLVETLVVISLIVLIISITLPALSKSRELARRSICASNMRQALIGIIGIADQDNGRLPSGKRNFVGASAAEHCIWVSDQWHNDVKAAAGGSDALFECVNFVGGFGYQNQYGWVIGYNYLGNHPRMNELGFFKSPVRMHDDPSLPVYVDLNNYAPNAWSFVAHTVNGARNLGGGPRYYNIVTAGAKPKDNGSMGGNVGLLDTSVRWKPIGEMKEYDTSEWAGSYPCFW